MVRSISPKKKKKNTTITLSGLLFFTPGAEVHLLLLQIWLGDKQGNSHWDNIMYSLFWQAGMERDKPVSASE